MPSILTIAISLIIILILVLLWKNPKFFREKSKSSKVDLSLKNINSQLDDQLNKNLSLPENQEYLFSRIFTGNTSPMLLIEPASGKILNANKAAETFYGYQLSKMKSMSIYEINMLSPQQIKKEMQKALTEKRNYFIFPHKLASGEIRQVEVHSSYIDIYEQRYLLTIVNDITERFIIEKNLALYNAALNQAVNAIAIFDKNRKIIWANKAYNDLTGYKEADTLEPEFFTDNDEQASIYEEIKKIMKSGNSWYGITKQYRKNSEPYYSETTITPVYIEEEKTSYFVTVMQDITQKRETEQQLKTLAFYDPLTNLPNKKLLRDRVETLMSQTARTKSYGAIIFLDLDRLKIFNDNYGHKVGDRLIAEVAKRIHSYIPEGDTLARFGGDEFVIVLSDLSSNPVKAAQESSNLAETIRLAVSNQPFKVIDQDNKPIEHTTSASMGMTIFQGTDKSLDDLLKWSEMAMYQAKASGRNVVRLFDPNMETQLYSRNELEQDLRKALDLQHFQLHYQPQVDYNGKILGAEALLRWYHPEKSFISPGEFIPIAEEAGLIINIGSWVLEEACRQLANWRKDPILCTLTLAVNISAKQLHHPNFVNHLSHLVRKHNINPIMLKLEITESVIIEHIEDTIRKMKSLRALGIQFSIDDFGTGYSSLSYLKQLPISQIKIDQSFVQDLGKDEMDASIVKAIINLGHNFQINIIAEGVETHEQLKILSSYKCEVFQGYYFNPPLPLDDFIALTRN